MSACSGFIADDGRGDCGKPCHGGAVDGPDVSVDDYALTNASIGLPGLGKTVRDWSPTMRERPAA